MEPSGEIFMIVRVAQSVTRPAVRVRVIISISLRLFSCKPGYFGRRCQKIGLDSIIGIGGPNYVVEQASFIQFF